MTDTVSARGLPADWKPRYGILLTVGDNPKARGKNDRYLAVISDGSPQLEHEETLVLSLETFRNVKDAKQWFKRMKIEQPWIAQS